MKQYLKQYLYLSLFISSLLLATENYPIDEYEELYNEDIATIEEEVFSVRGEKFSFGKSKRLLATKVYPEHQKAFYSDCEYKIEEKKLIPIHESCGFQYRKNKNRSERIEWEHIVPAWHFGHQLRCWQNGGRKNCRQTDKRFREMEADMHNLVPAIGEINGDRSNFKFGMIEGEKRLYGEVDMEISFSNRRAETPEIVFGDIARTYFYMRDKYGLRIGQAQQKMMIAWNNLDPVDEWEQKRNQLIKNLQGDENLYVTNYKTITQLGELKNVEQENSIEDSLSEEFNDIRDELSKKYAKELSYFTKTQIEIILFILTIFILYQRKKGKYKKKK